MPEPFSISLPWPPAELSPNARVHWSARHRATQEYRWLVWAKTRQATLVAHPWERAQVRVQFVVPDHRRRDIDNLLAMLKPAWDGVVDAGLLKDDSCITVAHVEKIMRPGQRLVLIEMAPL